MRSSHVLYGGDRLDLLSPALSQILRCPVRAFPQHCLLTDQHFNKSLAMLVFLELLEQRFLHLCHRTTDAMAFTFEFANVDTGTRGFGHKQPCENNRTPYVPNPIPLKRVRRGVFGRQIRCRHKHWPVQQKVRFLAEALRATCLFPIGYLQIFEEPGFQQWVAKTPFSFS